MNIYTVLVMALFFTIAAISNAIPSFSNASNSSPVQTTTQTSSSASTQKTQSDNPLINATFQTQAVKSGSGSSVGTCAYIKISKQALESITFQEYKEFIQKCVSSKYNWVSIICYDGTGIIFTGGETELASYGKLASDGSLIKTYGYIKLSTGKYIAASGMDAYTLDLSWGN